MKKLLLQIAAGASLLLIHGTLGVFMLVFYVILTAGINTANTAKVRAVESRVSTLESTAVQGDGSGDVTISGDLHVDGNLYGSGGTLNIGDTVRFNASGNGPSGGNTLLGLTNSQASFLATIQTAGGVTPPSTTWGGGAGCSLTTGNFNTNALTGLNQLEDAINELITALSNMNLLT
jgi:hypothetical protein